MKVIEVQDLKKVFRLSSFGKPIMAVNGLSFSVEAGRVVGFLGANGAGKTTTIKMLLGLIKSSSGEIRIMEQSPAQESSREEVGFLPERPYFYEYLTGWEFLRFYAQLNSKKISDSHLHELLGRVGLSEAADRPLRRYSKGMLQRIGFCQAIMHDPKLLILDEPMSGLDPDGRAEMAVLIKEVNKTGTTVFMSSHLLHDVEIICDEVIMIEKGKLVIQDSVSNLLERESRGFEIQYKSGKESQKGKLVVSTEAELQKQIDQLRAAGSTILQIHSIKPSLEEIFLKYKRASQ